MSEIIVKPEEDGNPQPSSVTPRQRKLRSVVWNDFTKELREDGSDIATCNHCKRKFTGASRSGTTHLRNHLRFCISYEKAKRKKLDIVRAQPSLSDEKSSGVVAVHAVDNNNALLMLEDGNSQIHEEFNDEEANNNNSHLSVATPLLRCRKLRSLVWNDFSKEQREDGSLVAICNHCKKQMAGGSRSGTTHLKKHLGKCLLYQRSKRRRGEMGQVHSKWGGGEIEGNSQELESLSVDQELVDQDLAHMVILHEYPFSMVNHIGFKAFVRDLQPRFRLMSAETLQENCMKVYEDRRLVLCEELTRLRSRVNFTVDFWSSESNVGYLQLRCHFIDDNWKLRHKVISFWHIDSPDESGIAKLILEKLTEWNIDQRVFSAVLENPNSSDKVVDELLQLLRSRQTLLLDGALFHVHSCSQILNLVVQDGLQVISELVNKVRYAVNFVRSTPARLESFRALGAPQKPLLIDDPSRWHTTYLMLTAACESQDVFASADGEFVQVPSLEDWENIKAVNECLGAFYLLTEKPSPRNSPTVNLCFNGMCGIHLSLKTWSGSSHPQVNAMASKMLEQFDKYWGLTSIILSAASVLDPRYKMKSIEYFFRLIYADVSEAELKIENVVHDFRSLYDAYAAAKLDRSTGGHVSSSDNCGELMVCENNGISKGSCSSQNPMADLRFGLDQYLQETSSSQPIKSDLDLYLEEAVHPPMKGTDDDFDILAWWKSNAPKYPVLSEMARDVLSVHVSISSPESGFRTKMLHPYHTSMDPITLQGLICAQDWLRSEIDESTLSGSADGLSTIFTLDRWC